MRSTLQNGRLVILLTTAEVMRLCQPGAGADTCIWLVSGDSGFECIYYCQDVKNLEGESMKERWQRGATVAKRNGCEEIKYIPLARL